jgi:hypothetical protein
MPRIDMHEKKILISADPDVASPAKWEGLAPSTPILEQIHTIVTRTATCASHQDFLHRQAKDDGLSSFAEPSHTEIPGGACGAASGVPCAG